MAHPLPSYGQLLDDATELGRVCAVWLDAGGVIRWHSPPASALAGVTSLPVGQPLAALLDQPLPPLGSFRAARALTVPGWPPRQVELSLAASGGGTLVLMRTPFMAPDLEALSRTLTGFFPDDQLVLWEIDVRRGVVRDYHSGGVVERSLDEHRDELHPDDLERLTEAGTRIFLGEVGSYTDTYRALDPNGEVRAWYLTRGRLERDEAGVPVRLLGVDVDITSQRMTEAQLHRLALHDPLTGLPNRELLRQQLEGDLRDARRHQRQVALYLLDLDRFHELNDALGQAQGDRLLVAVAQRLQGSVRRGDTLARISGDEFALVQRQVAGLDEAGGLAERLLGLFAEPFRLGDLSVQLSATVGIALSDAPDVEQLLVRGDLALRAAKAEGGGRFEFHGPGMTDWVRSHVRDRQLLQAALREGALVAWYQPQVDLRTGALVGLEALARWPTGPGMGPAQFVPLAERSGLAEALGRSVRAAVIRDLLRWRDAGLAAPPVALNASVLELRKADYAQRLLADLAAAGLPSSAVEVEITESAGLHQHPTVKANLEQLGQAGIPLALDDFGTGFSSLDRLGRLPVWRLKIAQEFVRGLPDDPEQVRLAKAAVELGRVFGRSILVEGVETPAARALLLSWGCEVAQGFLYSPPVPAAEAAAWIAAGVVPRA